MRKVICSWIHRLDIDAYACMVALCEVYTHAGDDVAIFLPPHFSSTITKEIASWEHGCFIVKNICRDDELIMVDVSDHHYLWQECDYSLDSIIEIIDHHPGSEKFRIDKMWSRAQIERVWAAATLVFERAQDYRCMDVLSDTAIRLLYAAIISNTLNFSSLVTTQRDITAHNVLLLHIYNRRLLSSEWKVSYFKKMDASILKNPEKSIKMDMKKKVRIHEMDYTIWQLELRDSKEFLLEWLQMLYETHKEHNNPHRFFTCPSISEGKTYILTDNQEVIEALSAIYTLYKWEHGYYQVDRLVLRKEWIRGLFAL